LILELGKGFAFLGSQYHFEVGGQDFFLDLLFYHLRLRCYVVFDLKIEEFKPEFAGKMNFYLSAVDDQLRHPDDQSSIGIILCKSRNELIVEYALRDTAKPMGVSQYRLATALPAQLQGQLPTREELAREMPYLSLVALRFDIERALQRLVKFRGIEPSGVIGIGQALQQLKESGEVPSSTDAFVRALTTMNHAVHGVEIGPSAMAEALRSGSEFLVQLRQLAE
jgi:YhcG PDDEXK nuclease domain